MIDPGKVTGGFDSIKIARFSSRRADKQKADAGSFPLSTTARQS